MILADDYIINSRRFPEEILSGSDLFPRQADRQGGRPEWSVSAKPFAASQGGGEWGGGSFRFRTEEGVRRKILCGFFPRDFHQPAAAPHPCQRQRWGRSKKRDRHCLSLFLRILDKKDADPQPAPPVPFGPESSEANRVRKRRNSHQSAVFGKAGNGTVVGISGLE